MISAATVQHLSTFTAVALTRAINQAGYEGDQFESAEFLGITKSCDFCYAVVYDDEGRVGRTQVYVSYDDGKVSVCY